MITCIDQRNEMTYFDVCQISHLLILSVENVQYGSTVFTDAYSEYDKLEHHAFLHKCVIHLRKNMEMALYMSIIVNA